MANIEIVYSAFAQPIETQLNAQGYTLGEQEEFIEKLFKAYLMCRIHLLTDSQVGSVLRKLHKEVEKYMKPIEGE